MKTQNMQHPRDSRGAVSRRGLLKGAAALAAAGSTASLAGPDREDDDRRGGPILAYVGCYTPNGLGIYLFRMDPGTGDLAQVKVFQTPPLPSPATVSPSWLALDPQKKYLYAANEIGNFNGTNGAVSAFSINRVNGDLTYLNTVSSRGSGPAHCSVDPSGKYVLVANYGGGNIAVIPIVPSGPMAGALGVSTDAKADNSACSLACAVGPARAVKAPPGSFAISGHDAPHAHMIQTDPGGNFVIVNDLGLDLTILWQFDRTAGTLSNPKTVPSSAGAGPRHFAFHPNGRWFYSLNEEASTLAFMIYDATHGTLTPLQEVSTLPSAFVGTNFTSEVRVSDNGRFVYCANRLHDTIAVFAIDATGAPRLIGEESTRGDYPRSFTIDPTGSFMYVCNQRGDSITTFRVDGDGRQLKFTGKYTAVGSPAVIVFL